MPELPEVETTRRGIDAVITNKTLKKLIVHESRMRWPIPDDLPSLVQGKTVLACNRRGKYLLIEFANGTQIVHLGMSGSLRNASFDEPLKKHDHVEWIFDKARFILHDPRRFGCVLWHPKNAGPITEHKLLKKLGVEPFSSEFTVEKLYQGIHNRQQAIKQLLLGGHIVVGVGNIYASESLFLAGIDPRTAGKNISKARCKKLHEAIILTLNRALESGGSTLRDYVNAQGAPGAYFEIYAAVYEKENKPCPNCGTAIKRIVQGQRATYFCPHCQKK